MDRKGLAIRSISSKDMKMLFLKEEDEDSLRTFDTYGKPREDSNFLDLPLYSREELYEYGNGIGSNPILLSLFGRVYDVSSGKKFYGPGGKYHSFAGRDVTRALSSGCLAIRCLGSDTSDGKESITLTQSEETEGKKWLDFFETHDSYAHVGMLNNGQTTDQLIDNIIESPNSTL